MSICLKWTHRKTFPLQDSSKAHLCRWAVSANMTLVQSWQRTCDNWNQFSPLGYWREQRCIARPAYKRPDGVLKTASHQSYSKRSFPPTGQHLGSERRTVQPVQSSCAWELLGKLFSFAFTEDLHVPLCMAGGPLWLLHVEALCVVAGLCVCMVRGSRGREGRPTHPRQFVSASPGPAGDRHTGRPGLRKGHLTGRTQGTSGLVQVPSAAEAELFLLGHRNAITRSVLGTVSAGVA